MKAKAPAVEKAFLILDFIGRVGAANFTEIFSNLDLPKSSVHNLLETLIHLGALRQTSIGSYTLGLKLFELGTLAVQNRNIRQDVFPSLQNLSHQVGLVCHFGFLEGFEAVYLLKVDSIQYPLKVNSWEGKRVSLYSSGLGKALLAWQDETIIEAYLQHTSLVQITPTTITSPERFKSHLADIRHQGWATDNGEDFADIRCLAAPVRDLDGQVKYAISITGTVSQLNIQNSSNFINHLLDCCQKIEHILGLSLNKS